MEAFLTNILFSLFTINFIQTHRSNNIPSAAALTTYVTTLKTVLDGFQDAIFCPE